MRLLKFHYHNCHGQSNTKLKTWYFNVYSLSLRVVKLTDMNDKRNSNMPNNFNEWATYFNVNYKHHIVKQAPEAPDNFSVKLPDIGIITIYDSEVNVPFEIYAYLGAGEETFLKIESFELVRLLSAAEYPPVLITKYNH